MHRLIHIHGSQRRYIKTGEPHINDNGNLHRVIVIFKLPCELLFVRFSSDDLFPIFRVIIAASHNHTDFIRPCGSNFQDTAIDFHCNRTRIRHNHSFTRQKICSIFFVMFNNIITERFYRRISSQHAFHLTKHFFALLDCLCVGLLL